MTAAPMRADCARCAALCCVALAFDRSEAFAIDKPNGVPCPHLDASDRCRIYGERTTQGFPGCVGYDCLGAGQRVTQELFGGGSWRRDPALLAPMIRAFTAMRRVHELLRMLELAGAAALSAAERAALRELEEELQPPQGWTTASLDAFQTGDAPARVGRFLASLRPRFSQEPGAPASV